MFLSSGGQLGLIHHNVVDGQQKTLKTNILEKKCSEMTTVPCLKGLKMCSDNMDPHEMSWAMAALAPLSGDLKPESLLSDVGLQEVKFVLNPVLPVRHFLRSLARLRLGEFCIASPLGFKPSLVHLH